MSTTGNDPLIALKNQSHMHPPGLCNQQTDSLGEDREKGLQTGYDGVQDGLTREEMTGQICLTAADCLT